MSKTVDIRGAFVGRFWVFNEDEDEALDYLPHIDQVLYLRGFRKNMDFATGIVGVRRKISYQMFKELLEIHRRRGSNKPEFFPRKEELRASLNRLEAAGLIEKIPSTSGRLMENMVFKLPLAHVGRISAEIEEKQSTTQPQHHAESVDSSGSVGVVNNTEAKRTNHTHHYNSNKDIKEYRKNSDEFDHSAHSDSVNLEKQKAVDQVGVGSGLGACPHVEILDLWKSIFPGQRQPNRNLWARQTAAAHLRSRWQEAAHIDHSNGQHKLYSDREGGLVWWGRFFTHLSKSKFLTSDESPFFDLAWLVKKANFYKALDGKYNNA